MIHIIHEKEDKKIAIQISQFLQSKGFTATLNDITSENSNSEVAVLIFSQKNNRSEKIISKYDYVFENDVPLIPFIISDVELSVSMQHFLNTHDWINAFDVSSKEAINDLSVLVTELVSPDKKNVPKKVTKNTNDNSEDKKDSKQKAMIIGVIAIFALILMYFIFGGKNNVISNSSNPDNLIAGSWKLADYQDNMPRNPSDYADFVNSIGALKQNFLLIFNDDYTFEKYGFSAIEKGNWQFDKQNMVLYMWPPGSDQQKDMLKIEKLTQDSLIMTIATQIDSLTLINTKFTLYKE